MTFRWQYQARAEPVLVPEDVTLDRWFQPISVPVRLSAATLALAALASTTQAIEPKTPLVETVPTPEILDWVFQPPDPVRRVESLTITQDFAYASYCFTNNVGPRKFTFASQSGDFIATVKVKADGEALMNSELLITNDPDPFGAGVDNAISLRWLDSGPKRITVNNTEPDQNFAWVVGTAHSVEVRVNLTQNVCTVSIDGTVIATDFSFNSGDLTPAFLDHWGFDNAGADNLEICDFRVVPDNSATEIVPTYTQSQPLPFPLPRPVDEGISVVDADLLTQPEDVQLKWHVQYPEPIQPAPLNQTAGTMAFGANPADFVIEGPITLDKWYQPLSEPIFLPVRLEHFEPVSVDAPLGAVPIIPTTEQAVNTFFANFVGVTSTKYRVRIRQIEGIGSVVLATVAGRATLRAQFYPRTVLLATNTLVQQTGLYDAHIEAAAANSPRVFDFLRARESGSPGNSNAHLCLEFDVTAFAGVLYRSVKLRLTNEENNDVFQSTFRLARIVAPWALSTGDVTWNQYDRNLTSPNGDWQIAGGRGSPNDRAEVVNWLDPDFPTPQAINTVTESPDITLLVNNAIKLNAGILKLMVQKVSEASLGSNINDFHSSRAPGILDSQKPHLFFDAF